MLDSEDGCMNCVPIKSTGLYVGDLRKLHEMCNHHGTIRKKVLPKVNKHLVSHHYKC